MNHADLLRDKALLRRALKISVGEPLFSQSQAREDDLRAAALEHEERQSLGRVEATEDDTAPPQ